MNIRFYPLRQGEFPARTKHRKNSLFKVGWNTVLRDLETELGHLGAKEVVISAGLYDDDIRIDGWPRANAKPWHPGVIISFDSKHGSLRYFSDEYDDGWSGRYLVGYQANIRAVSLGLSALRAVDRYGITRRGEQYTGWKALATGGPKSKLEAAAIVLAAAGVDGVEPNFALNDDEYLKRQIAAALRASHPDHGGSLEAFNDVQNARKVLMH